MTGAHTTHCHYARRRAAGKKMILKIHLPLFGKNHPSRLQCHDWTISEIQPTTFAINKAHNYASAAKDNFFQIASLGVICQSDLSLTLRRRKLFEKSLLLFSYVCSAWLTTNCPVDSVSDSDSWRLALSAGILIIPLHNSGASWAHSLFFVCVRAQLFPAYAGTITILQQTMCWISRKKAILVK